MGMLFSGQSSQRLQPNKAHTPQNQRNNQVIYLSSPFMTWCSTMTHFVMCS
jgi:hypothetical protein